ncbi:hypothetical protein HOY82DRAFT_13062 [Tuber indicum]|nr:hypothetical protein HOY82DRAFT_13062 [Tuber indicum]
MTFLFPLLMFSFSYFFWGSSRDPSTRDFTRIHLIYSYSPSIFEVFIFIFIFLRIYRRRYNSFVSPSLFLSFLNIFSLTLVSPTFPIRLQVACPRPEVPENRDPPNTRMW